MVGACDRARPQTHAQVWVVGSDSRCLETDGRANPKRHSTPAETCITNPAIGLNPPRTSTSVPMHGRRIPISSPMWVLHIDLKYRDAARFCLKLGAASAPISRCCLDIRIFGTVRLFSTRIPPATRTYFRLRMRIGFELRRSNELRRFSDLLWYYRWAAD